MPAKQKFAWQLRTACRAGAEQTYLAAKSLYSFLGVEDHITSVTRPGEHYQHPGDFARFLDFADAARAHST